MFSLIVGCLALLAGGGVIWNFMPYKDKCVEDNGRCEYYCSSYQGTVTCSCGSGYRLSSDGRKCIDTNECDRINQCHHYCVNTYGSFRCYCQDGYSLGGDGRTCSLIDECAEANGDCQQHCRSDHGRATCSCNTGFKLSSNGRNCLDIDECENIDLCHHYCENNYGSYECTCQEGYSLDVDQKTCSQIDNQNATVALIEDGNLSIIYEISPSLKTGEPKILPLDKSFSSKKFIYDPNGRKFLIVDDQKGLLLTEISNNSWTTEALNVSHISESCFEYVNRNLYIVKIHYTYQPSKPASEGQILSSEIEVYSLNNKILGKLICFLNETITAMKISVLLDKIVTCECSGECVDNQTAIVVRRTDGVMIDTIVKKQNMLCISLVIDEVKERIFWIDGVSDSIRSIQLDGQGSKLISDNMFSSMRNLAMFQHNLLFIANNHSLVKYSLFHSNFTYEGNLSADSLIANMDLFYYKRNASSCQNSTCQHVCVPQSTELSKCICAVGYHPYADKCLLKAEIHKKSQIRGSCKNETCNRGTCEDKSDGYIICRCPPELYGDYCDLHVESQGQYTTELTTGIIIFSFILTTFAVSLGLLIYKKRSIAALKNKLGSNQPYSLLIPSLGPKYELVKEDDDEAPCLTPAHLLPHC